MAGYTGKDLSVLRTYYEIYEVPQESQKVILNLILIMINRSILSASEKIKQEQNKATRNGK